MCHIPQYCLNQCVFSTNLLRYITETRTRGVIGRHRLPGWVSVRKLKGGCNVKSVAFIHVFRPWAWARYCSMDVWTSIYRAKDEPDPLSDLAIISS